MSTMSNLVTRRRVGRTAIITLNHPKRVNPIGRASNLAIRAALAAVNADSETAAVVLTGGEGRSFCAGGDFTEVSSMKEKMEVETWLEEVVALYEAVLAVEKPLVCALDGHAIGIGFQLALCADWRVAAPGASLIMWELQKGIACVLGAAMLDHCFGRLLMTELIYGCPAVDGRRALELHLVNELAEPDVLLQQAILAAERFASYPQTPFRKTKAFVNSTMRDVLSRALRTGKDVHANCFADGAAGDHFANILSR